MTEASSPCGGCRPGHIPTIEEGIERLDHLRAHGPTAHAFTFRDTFPAPPPIDR